MINSVYLISSKGSILLEKHFQKVTDKLICRIFLDIENGTIKKDSICPIIEGSKYSFIHAKENDVYLLAITEKEIAPLFVMEFLKRVIKIMVDYFKTVTEAIIEENIITIYEILDEMLDNGFPLVTESNILQELVRPPNVLRTMADKITSQYTFVSDTLPAGQLSMVPWRRADVKYPSNEAYFDFVEVIDTIFDKSGDVIISEVTGEIKANIHLSGIPDLTMYFTNPRLMDDLALHPCIRVSKWEKDKIFSFIPPEGVFTLCNYYVETHSNISLPVNIRSQSKIDENRSVLDLTVIGNKTIAKKPVENLIITVNLPKIVSTVIPTTCTLGKTKFNSYDNSLVWTIGKLEQFVTATLKAPICLSCNAVVNQDMGIDVTASFQIDQCAISGVSVNKVEISGEKYAPYKGVKYMTRAGKYHLRS